MSAWQPPSDYRNRPVTVLGAGVLGRRIACVWASTGYNVRIRDPSPEQRAAGIAYVKENVMSYAQKTGQTPSQVEGFESLEDAVANAWLVVEAVPENIEMKINIFAELATITPGDCILVSNSSSYKSSEMLEKVPAGDKARILNMHYYMPPRVITVELMTDGHTAEEIFPFLAERLKEAASIPYIVRKESTGLIFNRLWAAVNREILMVLAEGVSVPEEIDSMWTHIFIEGGAQPCKIMDRVGLDTVALIEGHFAEERCLSKEKTVDFLKKTHLDHGKLGAKSPKGGFYPPVAANSPKLLVLDIGMAGPVSSFSSLPTAGKILEVTADGKQERIVLPNQSRPDGIVVDSSTCRMFWTCMGAPGKEDGAVYSANFDGSDIKTLIAPGRINTPKQITIDCAAGHLYISDREGIRVYRCNVDGSGLETLICNSSLEDLPGQPPDPTKWCVGIAVAPKFGKFYWTQKGPSRGRQGRIFCASIVKDSSSEQASDIQCLVSGLPEPIDLEVDESSGILYWTDRGERPFGNSLSRMQLDASGVPMQKHEVICQNFNDAIGLKLDVERGHIYVTDLGGSIYRCNLDGQQKQKLYSQDSRSLTGICLI